VNPAAKRLSDRKASRDVLVPNLGIPNALHCPDKNDVNSSQSLSSPFNSIHLAEYLSRNGRVK